MKKKLLLFFALLPFSAFSAEKDILKKHPKLFSRTGKKLSIILEGQKTPLTFTDNSKEGEQYKENSLLSYYPNLNVALLQHFYNEGGDYTLLSLKTGSSVVIAERPIWNKKKNLFVSVNEGEYPEDKDGLQLGLCDGKECRLLLKKDGRYSKAKWISQYRLQATNRIPSADGGEGLVLRVRCTVQQKNQTASCVP